MFKVALVTGLFLFLILPILGLVSAIVASRLVLAYIGDWEQFDVEESR